MDHPLPAPQAAGAAGSGAPPQPPLPVLLQMAHVRVLLAGGGPAALELLTALLHNASAAMVTVVAAPLLPTLRELASRHGGVRLLERPFQETDLAGHALVFAATDDPTLNRRISAAATGRGMLAHVAGAPAESSIYLPTSSQAGEGQTTLAAAPSRAQRAAPQRALGPAYEAPATAYWRRMATGSLVAFAGFILLNILSYYVTWPQAVQWLTSSGTFYAFVAVGFVAQLIDGVLGMGYGVVSAISLMSLGLNPAAVSASIHTAEMFASGASGYHHYRFGNVNKKLFRVLLLPGIAGSISGAYLLSRFGEEYAAWVKPLLALYLLVLGVRILTRAFGRADRRRKVRHAGWLAGAGGFLDSFGGGGWGPLVTSTLITNGRTPRYVIGTVSITEFFVTFASAFTFFAMRGLSHWQIVAGLIVGGVAAAPLAARLAGRMPTRWMFIGVGLMVIVWSLWALRKVFL
ncbi:TSUP family transporter [Hymenobacter armeniacus]|uniref:Probable membrane transporter protein n=1 Tax=Hymenobacter armeniacus TaxID=2771358 RepID=A0ABR8JLY0_9BACT|nr:TSUP family transporter [Hymenobacter armeniacus]MBD2721005.1 TSUP family transporter [Hymenobacter armeniacus]